MSTSSRFETGSTSAASDETTPLLKSVSPAPIPETADSSRQHRPNGLDHSESEEDEGDEFEKIPFPKVQVFLLCYTAIVEPIAFFGIFPYINFMIEKVGNVDEKEVGFYSGLIESLFSATQMCVMILWGKVCMHCFSGSKEKKLISNRRRQIATAANQSSSSPCLDLLLRPLCSV